MELLDPLREEKVYKCVLQRKDHLQTTVFIILSVSVLNLC